MNPTDQTVITSSNSNSFPSQNFTPTRTAKGIKSSTDSKTREIFRHIFFLGETTHWPYTSHTLINLPQFLFHLPQWSYEHILETSAPDFTSSNCSQLCDLIANSKELASNSGIRTEPSQSCVLATSSIASS